VDKVGESGIGRMWRGWTNRDQADGYEAVFRDVVLPELHDVAGCRGAFLLRRDDANGAEFVTLTLFDSLDAVRAFAGEQYETAVISDEARAVLRDFDTTAQHFTVVIAPTDAA
jgi:heme-degrading monooxygenase HmoA